MTKSAYILLRSADGRNHSVIVVLNGLNDEDTLTHAEAHALEQVSSAQQDGWHVEDSYLADQTIVNLNSPNE